MVVKRPRRLNVLIDDAEWAALQRLANAERVSVSDYIRLALWRDHAQRFGGYEPGEPKPNAPKGVPVLGIALEAGELAGIFDLPEAQVTKAMKGREGSEVFSELKRLASKKEASRFAPVKKAMARKARAR